LENNGSNRIDLMDRAQELQDDIAQATAALREINNLLYRGQRMMFINCETLNYRMFDVESEKISRNITKPWWLRRL